MIKARDYGEITNLRHNYRALFFSIISGCLLFFSFPKFGIGLIAWVALIPLFYALKNADVKNGFFLGFLAGLVSNLGILYWIVFVLVTYGYLPIYIGIFALLLLSSYLAIYTGLFACGVVLFKRYGIGEFISAPFLWVILEYVKSHILTGFPWANLGQSQYLYLPLIQIVDTTGVYGLSFVIVLVNAAIFNLLMVKRDNISLVFAKFAFVVLILSSIYLYGLWRIDQVNSHIVQAPKLQAALIQGNIDQNIKWNPSYQDKTIEVYKSLSREVIPDGNGLIVWPETATPFYFQETGDRQNVVLGIAGASRNWLLFGSPSYRKDRSTVSYFNSAFLISPAGEIHGQYDKVHLVPYGEYVPLRRFFPFLTKLVAGAGDFSSGKGYFPLEMGNNKLGVLICYEAIFPLSSWSYKRQGANLLVNITNDAWFGRTSAPYQHLSMTTFRAIENRLFVLRAANTGISAIIDPTGNITSQTKLFERTTLSGIIKLASIDTFYGRHGDVFVLMCLISTALMILIIYGRKRNARLNKQCHLRSETKD